MFVLFEETEGKREVGREGGRNGGKEGEMEGWRKEGRDRETGTIVSKLKLIKK